MISEIEHYNISGPMDLLDDVRDFYVNVLGLEEGFRPQLAHPGYWLYAGDKAIIHLIESHTHHRAEHSGHLDHIALKANDAEAMEHRLRANGVEYHKATIDDIGVTQFFFHDPAGTQIEINIRASSNDAVQ